MTLPSYSESISDLFLFLVIVLSFDFLKSSVDLISFSSTEV